MIPVSYDFECPTHGVFDTILDRREFCDTHPCPECDEASPRILSAVMGRIKRGEVQQGASEPCPPHVMDCEPLADGMPYEEWKGKQREKQAAETREEIKGLTS